ncbi:MAG: acetyl-CoA carboxylase biotin carboxyl carrier protein [bacterium]
MDLKQLQKVIEIFESSSLSELEIEEAGTRFRLAKHPKGGSFKNMVKSEVATQSEEVQAMKPRKKPPKEKKPLTSVRSPLVGTFYRAPSPEEKPYVEVEDEVMVGQTLCIIEAMKVMNEITSEVEGKIKEVLVKNGHPVEYDQELFLIEER